MYIYDILRRPTLMSKTLFSSKVLVTDIIIVVVIAICIFTVCIVASAFALAYAEQQQQQQDVITIIPDANDKNNPVFFDITYYQIQIGKELRWYNADDVNHKIIISNGNETDAADIENKKVIESGDIKPKASFSYKFDKTGTYRFSSPIYPWMHGNVIV
jgi:plastocyanin